MQAAIFDDVAVAQQQQKPSYREITKTLLLGFTLKLILHYWVYIVVFALAMFGLHFLTEVLHEEAASDAFAQAHANCGQAQWPRLVFIEAKTDSVLFKAIIAHLVAKKVNRRKNDLVRSLNNPQ
ncbi:MAG: hypothetical protein EOP50_00240 [Sphingobacteriales bacterium]|nr:MAG: hypothetical protein EOP50_00240 [Sphingobacteriales bacterium]